MYDGRRDASGEEIRRAIGDLGRNSLAPPLWVIERIWPYMHVGYKTENYTGGIVAKALEQSLFKDYKVAIDSAYVKIVLRKG